MKNFKEPVWPGNFSLTEPDKNILTISFQAVSSHNIKKRLIRFCLEFISIISKKVYPFIRILICSYRVSFVTLSFSEMAECLKIGGATSPIKNFRVLSK